MLLKNRTLMEVVLYSNNRHMSHCTVIAAGVAVIHSICEEFETIAERALQEVATTEELMEMIDYIEEARTNGMRKLNERVIVSRLLTISLFLFIF